MKIAIEKHIPFIRGVFEPVADVVYLEPEEFTPEAVTDADAIITRTRTRCDATLLDNSRCRIIATATIGTDHIDLDYCLRRGITVENAPGCNAPAVAQWVFAAINAITDRPLNELTIGIVGVGHVGRIVETWARSMDMKVLLCDPPRALSEGKDQFVDFDEIARKADIITFHTPLTRTGDYPTYHLCDRRFIESLTQRPIILNAARGAVTDTAALISGIENGLISAVAIDCWEHEPKIDLRLLELAKVATPHIAGYSREGKIRATAMAVDAVSRHLGITPAPMEVAVPVNAPERITPEDINYNILADTSSLRKAASSLPTSFETLRNSYNLRNEPAPTK